MASEVTRSHYTEDCLCADCCKVRRVLALFQDEMRRLMPQRRDPADIERAIERDREAQQQQQQQRKEAQMRLTLMQGLTDEAQIFYHPGPSMSEAQRAAYCGLTLDEWERLK